MSKFLESSPANAHFFQQLQQLTLNSFGGNLSKQITKKLANIVKFALTADKCTAIYGREMLRIMVRYLNGKEIIESFVIAVPVASKTAEVITSAIVEHMKINNLNLG